MGNGGQMVVGAFLFYLFCIFMREDAPMTPMQAIGVCVVVVLGNIWRLAAEPRSVKGCRRAPMHYWLPNKSPERANSKGKVS